MAIDFSFNPSWQIQDMNVSVGISGDVDAHVKGTIDWAPITDKDLDSYVNAYEETVNVWAIPRAAEGHEFLVWKDNYDFDFNSESNEYLGSCGGCELNAIWGREDDDDSFGNAYCRSEHDDYFTDTKGRCQNDCPRPWYSTCVPEMDANLLKDLMENQMSASFSVVVVPGEGVNIRSCESGLRAKVQVGVKFTCNGTDVECAPLYSGEDDDEATGEDDAMMPIVSYENATKQYCVFKKGYIKSAFVSLIFDDRTLHVAALFLSFPSADGRILHG